MAGGWRTGWESKDDGGPSCVLVVCIFRDPPLLFFLMVFFFCCCLLLPFPLFSSSVAVLTSPCVFCRFRSGGYGYAVQDQAGGPDADHGGDEEGNDVSASATHHTGVAPAHPAFRAVEMR